MLLLCSGGQSMKPTIFVQLEQKLMQLVHNNLGLTSKGKHLSELKGKLTRTVLKELEISLSALILQALL